MLSKEVWFTADLHFGHANMIKFSNRPWDTAEEMDEGLIANWNSVVKPNDFVYLLGDVAYASAKRMLWLMSRLNGRIGLILGNHDKGIAKGDCAKRFEWIENLKEIYIHHEGKKQKIILCHYPMLTWNKSHRGSWNLHGHCHGNLPYDSSALRMDVGVDCNDYRPICYEEVQLYMSKKEYVPLDHHR